MLDDTIISNYTRTKEHHLKYPSFDLSADSLSQEKLVIIQWNMEIVMGALMYWMQINMSEVVPKEEQLDTEHLNSTSKMINNARFSSIH